MKVYRVPSHHTRDKYYACSRIWQPVKSEKLHSRGIISKIDFNSNTKRVAPCNSQNSSNTKEKENTTRWKILNSWIRAKFFRSNTMELWRYYLWFPLSTLISIWINFGKFLQSHTDFHLQIVFSEENDRAIQF